MVQTPADRYDEQVRTAVSYHLDPEDGEQMVAAKKADLDRMITDLAGQLRAAATVRDALVADLVNHIRAAASLLPVSVADEHPACQLPDATDVDLIKAAFNGQIGWDRREGFLYVLGPRASERPTEDERNRLARLIDVGLLTYCPERGYSGVTSTQAGFKYTYTWS